MRTQGSVGGSGYRNMWAVGDLEATGANEPDPHLDGAPKPETLTDPKDAVDWADYYADPQRGDNLGKAAEYRQRAGDLCSDSKGKYKDDQKAEAYYSQALRDYKTHYESLTDAGAKAAVKDKVGKMPDRLVGYDKQTNEVKEFFNDAAPASELKAQRYEALDIKDKWVKAATVWAEIYNHPPAGASRQLEWAGYTGDALGKAGMIEGAAGAKAWWGEAAKACAVVGKATDAGIYYLKIYDATVSPAGDKAAAIKWAG